MNKLIRLSKSGIEYLDYAWNFYSGCLHKQMGVCSVDNCWAKGITERFIQNYPNGFEPTYYPEAFLSPLYLKKPSIIGCAFMGDLFGDWVDPDKKFHSVMPSGKASITMALKGWIFTTIKQCPQHTFLFLTKQPQNLIKFSPFPDNCWVGVSATGSDMFYEACYQLKRTKATVKYISLEPLLNFDVPATLDLGKWIYDWLSIAGIKWVIIGAQTKPYKPPKIEWVEEIALACTKAHIPLFLKDNLKPLLGQLTIDDKWAWAKDLGYGGLQRQEMPR